VRCIIEYYEQPHPVLAQKSIGSRSPFIRNNRAPRLWTDDRSFQDMCASVAAGGEGPDLTDGIAVDGLRWLRPRDVRSDNGGRRPPEMQRSCQPTEIGCGGGPDNLCLVTDAFCSCDNSENNKTKRDVGAPH
jgi:hypothetical protein